MSAKARATLVSEFIAALTDGGGNTVAEVRAILQDYADSHLNLTDEPVTAAALTVLDDATVAAMVNTLGGASSTGTGGLVRETSPTLVSPALGTPSSGNGGNLTTLNATQLTTGTIPAARIGADTIDALTEIVAALKAGTGAKLVTNGNDASVPIYTEVHSGSHTIDAAECYGGYHIVTATGTITLPPGAAGMHLTVKSRVAASVHVKPDSGDKMYLDGVVLDDGDKASSTDSLGDLIALVWDGTDWDATSNDWTDGGA